MEIKKIYLYEMPEINLKIDGEIIQLKPIVELFIPINYEDWEDAERVILKVVDTNLNQDIYEKIFRQYKYIVYRDKIPKRGKNKWVLLESKSNTYKVEDLPDCIWSSLNTHEHPSKRNWFIDKNCGFLDVPYEKTVWENYDKFNLLHENFDVELHYKLIILFTNYYVLEKGITVGDSYSGWKDLINYQFKQNHPIYSFFNEEYIAEMHETRLRDILNMW